MTLYQKTIFVSNVYKFVLITVCFCIKCFTFLNNLYIKVCFFTCQALYKIVWGSAITKSKPELVHMLHSYSRRICSNLLPISCLKEIFCSTCTQLNYSPRHPPPVTACQEAFLWAPCPPAVMTIAKMQRQPTWQQQLFSTCPPAAGRDQRHSAPRPGSPAPRWCTVNFI